MFIEDETPDALLIRRAFEKTGIQNPIQTLVQGDKALA